MTGLEEEAGMTDVTESEGRAVGFTEGNRYNYTYHNPLIQVLTADQTGVFCVWNVIIEH